MALNLIRNPKDIPDPDVTIDPRNFKEAMVDPKGTSEAMCITSVKRSDSCASATSLTVMRNPKDFKEPKCIMGPKNLHGTNTYMDPRETVYAKISMDTKCIIGPRNNMNPKTMVDTTCSLDDMDSNNVEDPKDIMGPKLGMNPDRQKKIFALDLGLTVSDTEIESPKPGIEKKILRFKIHYFLLLAGLGAVAPFTAVFAQKSLGLSATSFAMAVMLQQFSSIFIKLLIGYAANFLGGRLKLLIGCLAIGQVLLNLVLFQMPAVPSHPLPSFPPLVSYRWCRPRSVDVHLLNKLSRRDECFPTNSSSPLSDMEDMWAITIPPRCESLPVFSNSTLRQENDRGEGGALPCQHNTSVLCSVHPSSWCVQCCSNITEYYLFESEEVEEEVVDQSIQSDFQTLQFWLFALVFSALYACTYSVFTLSDTACCEGVDFTRLKMCGPMAWGVMSVFGGFLSYRTGSFLPACAVMAVATLLMLWNLSKLDLEEPTFSEKIFQDVKVVFGSKEFVAFQIGVLLNAIGHGIIWFYLIWFLTTMDGSLLLCGLVHTVQCLAGEVPFLFFSAWMVRKMGHFNATSLSLLAYSVRFFWYSQLKNPWHVLPIEFTHGITFGVYYTTVTSFTKFKARKGAEANTLSAMFTTFNGLGAGIGNILAGVCIDYFGGHRPFFVFGVAFAIFSVINVIYTFITRNDNKIIIKIIPPPED